jgi:hypothetical protein
MRAVAAAAAASGMKLGMNLGGITSYDGAYPFNNLMFNAVGVSLISGTATYTQDQGVITVSSVTGTAVFQYWLSDNGYGLSAGAYTVLNPNGYSVGVGPYGLQTYTGGYTTATSATATYVADGMFLTMQVTTPGTYGAGLAVILPGQLAAYQSGDIFNSEFVAYYATMNSPVIRTMDWARTNSNIDTDWTDRHVTGKPTYSGTNYECTPWETIIAMANKLGKDVWINVPVRATQAYVDSLAALFQSTLNSSLNVYVETANEAIFNTASLFAAAYNWIQSLTYTRINATVNAATDVVTKTAHGLANNAVIRPFVARSTRLAQVSDNQEYYFRACWGVPCYVEVVDANSFKLWDASGPTGNQIPFPTGVTELIYIVDAEAGKSQDLTGNMGTLALRNWNAFISAMGSTRVKPVIGSHSSNSSKTTDLLAVSGVAAKTPKVAIAPYFAPFWFGGAVDRTSNTFTPKAWSNAGSTNRDGETMTAHFAVYANGSTPTPAQIKAGTGTGYVGRVTPWTANYTSGTYTGAGAGVTVVNGTTYTCFMLFVDSDGYTHTIQQNIAAAAGPDTVDVLDSYANQARRCEIGMIEGPFTSVDAHISAIAASASPSSELVDYEGGMHLDETAPAAIANWMIAFTESSNFGDALESYVRGLASKGVMQHQIFSDVSRVSLSWSTSDSYADTGDERFIAMSGFAGNVPIPTELSMSDVVGTDVTADPGNFPTPTTVATLTSGYTYTILKGDDEGNYQIGGNLLQMVNDVGVDWGAPVSHTLTLLVDSGTVKDAIDVTFVTGEVPASGFDPATLFASSQKGFWYDPSDLSTLFQDTAGTTPVTTSGQSVGKMLDKSGNGAHIVFQNTNLPTYLVSSGLKSIVLGNQTNGWSGNLDMTAHSVMTVCLGFKKDTDTVPAGWGGVIMAFGEFDSSPTRGFEIAGPDYDSAGGNKGFGVLNTTGNVAEYATHYVSGLQAPVARVITATFDRTQATILTQSAMRLNGVAQSGSTLGAVVANAAFTSSPVILGARNMYGTAPPIGRFYGAICRGGSNTGTDISNMENWVGAKTGFAL